MKARNPDKVACDGPVIELLTKLIEEKDQYTDFRWDEKKKSFLITTKKGRNFVVNSKGFKSVRSKRPA